MTEFDITYHVVIPVVGGRWQHVAPESAYAQARHAGWVKAYAWLAARAERDTSGAYMLTKRLAERYPDEYSEVTG